MFRFIFTLIVICDCFLHVYSYIPVCTLVCDNQMMLYLLHYSLCCYTIVHIATCLCTYFHYVSLEFLYFFLIEYTIPFSEFIWFLFWHIYSTEVLISTGLFKGMASPESFLILVICFGPLVFVISGEHIQDPQSVWFHYYPEQHSLQILVHPHMEACNGI